MNQFDVSIDPSGNFIVTPGTVVDLTAATTTTIRLGTTFPSNIGNGTDLRTVDQGAPFFVGGSGESMRTVGTLSSTVAPIGYFTRTADQVWIDNFGSNLNGFGTSANIEDDTDIIATFASSYTLAPVGTFNSTSYGATNYNGGTAFTLTTSWEGGATASTALVEVFSGTAQAGTYTEATFSTWTNSTWTINSSTGQISDGTNVVASATSIGRDPTNTYDSTTYGANTYNLGLPFTMSVRFLGRMPKVGYVYVEIVLASGAFSTARGPFFATSLPANSATLEVVPIAYSDGSGVITQLVNGAILFR